MLLVVGGHSRNIGKTSVACGIIRHFRHLDWTAIKLSQDAKHTTPGAEECCWEEETGLAPAADSGRFLAAGARRALWVRTAPGRLELALPRLHEILAIPNNVLVESNSLLGYIAADLFVMVLDGTVADFKPSSARLLRQADFLVRTSSAALEWLGTVTELTRSKPCFEALPPAWESVALYRAIEQRMARE